MISLRANLSVALVEVVLYRAGGKQNP